MKEIENGCRDAGTGESGQRPGEKDPDEICSRAMRLAGEDNEESLTEAMRLFRCVKDRPDAERQYADCRARLERIRWQKESAVIKVYERRHEIRMKRVKWIGLGLLAAALICFGVIASKVLAQYTRYNRAEEYLVAGEYTRAADAFMEMGDYRDSKAKVYEAAIQMYNLKMYDEALTYFVWLDGAYDKGYYLTKCRERLGLVP